VRDLDSLLVIQLPLIMKQSLISGCQPRFVHDLMDRSTPGVIPGAEPAAAYLDLDVYHFRRLCDGE
jgi:hypothetical protein